MPALSDLLYLWCLHCLSLCSIFGSHHYCASSWPPMVGAFSPTASTLSWLAIVGCFCSLILLLCCPGAHLAFYSFPWPALHVPFALEFPKSCLSYMQSQFYVSGSMKGPLSSYFRPLPCRISETLLPKLEVPNGKTFTNLHKNKPSPFNIALPSASHSLSTEKILDNPIKESLCK